MNNIILASHGEMSQGLKQTVSMLLGDCENIYALSAFRDEDESVVKGAENLISKVGTKNLYILTDIFGGSVNNELLVLQNKYPDIHLIAGMNLPLVISIAAHPEKISEDQLNQILEESRQGIIDCKKLLTTKIKDEGEDL